jgi:signal transduction histidine kinase/CheY-like chemotaxis protein
MASAIISRSDDLFRQHQQSIYERTDRIFAGLMLFQWLAAVVAALVISPRTWSGQQSQVHFHVWVAILLGGVVTALPVTLAQFQPGRISTRHVIAVGQMLMSALLIHLTGGRIETHFHVFGSLAILAFYRDWRVLLSATVVVAADHFLRGMFAPQSVYGLVLADRWRWLEHASWVLFEDTFLMLSCIQSLREMRGIAERQAQMEQAKEAAEQANAAKSAFLSRMSHELRTPLNGILGFGQLLEMQDLKERDQESVEHILKAGRHLLGLINEVLDISRVESGSLSLSLESVQVGSVVQEAADLVRPLAEQRHIRLVIANENDYHIVADQQRLKQVLLNLLSNAIKYNREFGQVSITYRQTSDHRLTLSVTDTGEGILPEMLDRIFTPFDRLGAERTNVEGTGLGLAVSRALAVAMGANLTVASEPGIGSAFSIDMTLADNPHRTEALRDAEISEVAVETGSSRHLILYVEDNAANLKLVESIMERRPNIRLISATRGEQGAEMAHTHRPDLALLDLNLPDISGLDVLRRLQQDPETRTIPVVMITADATAGQEQRILDAGATAYLTKPINIKQFLEVVDETLKAA